MTGEVFTAIYSEFIAAAVDSDVTQTGDLMHGIYAGIAPEEARMPYVTVNIISSVPVPTFDGDNITDVRVQFSIFSDSDSTTEVENIRDNLIAAFDRTRLTYTSKQPVGCLRVGETLIRFDDCWQHTVDYRIIYQ